MHITARIRSRAVAAAVTMGLTGLGVAAMPTALADTGSSSVDISGSLAYIDVQFDVPYQDSTDPSPDPKSKPEIGTCTGWKVAQQGNTSYFMTDDHCVDPAEVTDILEQSIPPNITLGKLVGPKILIGPAKDADGQTFADDGTVPGMRLAQVVDTLPIDGGDVALLRVDNMPGNLIPLHMASTPAKRGDEISTTGFPGAVVNMGPRLVTTFGHVSSNPEPTKPSGVYQITADLAVSEGMSGAPIVNQDGDVVAMVDRSALDPSTGTPTKTGEYETDQTTIANFLQKNGLGQTQELAANVKDAHNKNVTLTASDMSYHMAASKVVYGYDPMYAVYLISCGIGLLALYGLVISTVFIVRRIGS